MCKKRNELVKELAKIVDTNHQVQTIQKRPYTCIVVTLTYENEKYTGTGFAKVQYPDTWNKAYGVELCVKKALADIARQIMK